MQRKGHTFSQGDLFHSYDLEKFEFKDGAGSARDMKKIYKYGEKRVLVAKIFWTFIKLVMRDMVMKGVTFHLNTKNLAMFTWKSVTGPEFVKAYQSGKFDDVDFLSANFTLYIPIFKYFYRGKFKERDLIMDSSLRAERVDKINKGFKYC
jgi:hypothetical protein